MPTVMRKHRQFVKSRGVWEDREHPEHFCEVCGQANAAFGNARGWFCGWNGKDAVCSADAVAQQRELR